MAYVRGIIRQPLSGSNATIGEILSQQQLATMSSSNPSVAAVTVYPGSAARTYEEWAQAIRAAAGVTLVYRNRTAGRFAAATFVPRVNARQWAMPDAFTNNGQYGYYFAPSSVDKDSHKLSQATPEEIEKGAAELRSQWWQGPLKAVAMTVAGGIVLAALTRKLL